MISTPILKDDGYILSCQENTFSPDVIHISRFNDVRFGMTINGILYTALIEKVRNFINYRVPSGRCLSVIFISDKVEFDGAYGPIKINLKLKLMRNEKNKGVFMFYNDVCYVGSYHYFREFLTGLRNFVILSNVNTLNIKSSLSNISNQDKKDLGNKQF